MDYNIILPPYLYNVYTDVLSFALNATSLGSHYLDSINHLAYADAGCMVLLSPTSYELQKVLDICEELALNKYIVYNTKNTVCMDVHPKHFQFHLHPQLNLNNTILASVYKFKYLSYV